MKNFLSFKYIVTLLLCFNVLTWNLAYSANSGKSQSKIVNPQIEKENPLQVNPEPEWLFVALAIVVIAVSATICYTIVKCADKIPSANQQTNKWEKELSGPLNKDMSLSLISKGGSNSHVKKNIVIQKTYDNGNSWIGFTNIFADPTDWAVRDYTPITNNFRPDYRAFYIQ